MTTVSIDYFGMPGTGRTVTEAKQDAGRKIDEAMNGSYAPVLLTHRGRMLVMSREPRFGWGYRLFDVAELKPYTSADHCSCGFDSRESCLLAAVRHMADLTREHGERDSVLFDALPTRQQSRERADFAYTSERNDIFQDRYREAIARGMKEGDAHDYAGMNPARRELWEPIAA